MTRIAQPMSTHNLRNKVREALAAKRSEMTLTLARRFEVPELQVIRALPDDMAVELDAAQWEAMLRDFESLGNVHVIVSNGSTTLEAFGRFGNFSTWGNFFNVQTKSLDMHIRADRLAAVFAVEKPSHMDDVPTVSFQFFDEDGHAAFKAFLTFGGKKPSDDVLERFDELRQRYRRPANE